MKYYIDFEFIQGTHKPLFGKRRHFIDMVSIGIVAEDGACYSAISSEYNYKDASDWVKENVISQLSASALIHEKNIHKVIGKPVSQIASEVKGFIKSGGADNPVFIGHYCSFDYVLFSQMFGAFADYPQGYPMYFIDLKQTFDEKVESIFSSLTGGNPEMSKKSFSEKIDYIKLNDKCYPVQWREHSALDDAKFIRDLDRYLNIYSK